MSINTNGPPIVYRLSAAAGKVLLAFAELIIGRFSPAIEPTFRNPDYDWIEQLEQCSEQITTEYNNYLLQGNAIPPLAAVSFGQQRIEKQQKWRSLFLITFNQEVKHNADCFPKTMQALKKVKGLNTAFFSVLEPEASIKPHRGLYKGLLRCHLPLIVPENSQQCAIIINGKTYHWQTNKAMVFDDTLEHEAYNRSSQIRVALIIDFERPLPRWLRPFNKAMLRLIGNSPYIKTLLANLNRYP